MKHILTFDGILIVKGQGRDVKKVAEITRPIFGEGGILLAGRN